MVKTSIYLIVLQAAKSSAGALLTSWPVLARRWSASPLHFPRDDRCSIHDGFPRRVKSSAQLCMTPQQGEFEPIGFADAGERGSWGSRHVRRVWLYDLVSTSTASQHSTVPYHEAWDFQKSLVEHQLSRIGKRPQDPPLYDQFVPLSVDCNGDDNSTTKDTDTLPFLGCDSIIMLQHDPVYTLGTASDASFIRGYDENDTHDKHIPIVRIERGGEVTYHGPGQLTVYPILDLRGYAQDIHWYMRALEEVVLLALDRAGVKGSTREENLTGVWVSNRKIAALGIKARRWVTMHGVAINVDSTSLRNFQGIIPCGLEGRAVTCVNDEAGGGAPRLTVEEFTIHVKKALEEVFGVTLVSTSVI